MWLYSVCAGTRKRLRIIHLIYMIRGQPANFRTLSQLLLFQHIGTSLTLSDPDISGQATICRFRAVFFECLEIVSSCAAAPGQYSHCTSAANTKRHSGSGHNLKPLLGMQRRDSWNAPCERHYIEKSCGRATLRSLGCLCADRARLHPLNLYFRLVG